MEYIKDAETWPKAVRVREASMAQRKASTHQRLSHQGDFQVPPPSSKKKKSTFLSIYISPITTITCLFRVVNEIHSSATKKNKEWQDKLPLVVLKAEEIMYSKANSEVFSLISSS